MKIYRGGLGLLMAVLLTGAMSKPPLKTPEIDREALLERHNYYRKQVGVPPLKWSDELADYAQKWANHLAKSCDMVHSTGKYGENIFWTSGKASPQEVVDKWASEERYFNHKSRVYKKVKGSRSGHYSQMIWRKTTLMGGAMQKCRHGGEIWVCNYDPHGNVIGQKAY